MRTVKLSTFLGRLRSQLDVALNNPQRRLRRSQLDVALPYCTGAGRDLALATFELAQQTRRSGHTEIALLLEATLREWLMIHRLREPFGLSHAALDALHRLITLERRNGAPRRGARVWQGWDMTPDQTPRAWQTLLEWAVQRAIAEEIDLGSLGGDSKADALMRGVRRPAYDGDTHWLTVEGPDRLFRMVTRSWSSLWLPGDSAELGLPKGRST